MSQTHLIEERLEKISNILNNVTHLLDNVDIEIPEVAKDAILKVLNSDDINELHEGLKSHRPPRIIIMGRSGVGKSSLINAMFGTYLAETSPINVGTVEHKRFSYKKDGRVIFEIIDTRGIKENINTLDTSAEEDLYKLIKEFNPDAFFFLTNGADRSTLHEDTDQLKTIFTKLNLKTPLITVITRVDEIQPARIKRAEEYTGQKLRNIKDKERQVKAVLREANLPNKFVVAVSSYVEWDHDDPESLTEEEQKDLKIAFDGRYNLEALIDILEDNIDFSAAIDMMLNHEFDKSLEKIANNFVKRFSNVSFIVGTSPIPVMDAFILLPIQIVEVMVIGYLSGVEVDAKSAREFIMSLGAVFLFGYGLRFTAQQGTKLLHMIPAVGSTAAVALSGGIAYSGTYSVGKAAIAHYIHGASLTEVKKVAEKAKEEVSDIESSNSLDEVTSDEESNVEKDVHVELEDNSDDDKEDSNRFGQAFKDGFNKSKKGVKKGFNETLNRFGKVKDRFTKDKE